MLIVLIILAVLLAVFLIFLGFGVCELIVETRMDYKDRDDSLKELDKRLMRKALERGQ